MLNFLKSYNKKLSSSPSPSPSPSPSSSSSYVVWLAKNDDGGGVGIVKCGGEG